MVHEEWCEKCGTYLVFTHDKEGKVILKCGECGNTVNKKYYHWELEKELKEVWDCKWCGSTKGVEVTSFQEHRAFISGIGKLSYDGITSEKTFKKKGICLKCGKKTPRPWVRTFYKKDWDDEDFPTPKNDKKQHTKQEQ